MLPTWWDDYECPYLSFLPTLLPFSYYGGFFPRSGLGDRHRVITLAIFELAVLAGFQSLLYAAKTGGV